MLVSPKGEKYYAAFKLGFACTNNTTEYEGLIQGLEWARKRGIKNLKVHGDSELIVNQVRGLNAVKNDNLKAYKLRVWDSIEDFDAFNIVAVPRSRNQHADWLAAVGAQYDIPNSIKRVCDQQHIKIIIRPSIPDNNVNWQVFESDEQILQFLLEEDVFAASN
ncbi:uncharacterized protein LOC131037573 [Cryptomeria japonica]|uniref:uncharacterized protein LOC131037573 n=1 Tax=Cryptomeria japonica TaxID=3369 RepID=UPI0025ABAA9B|nr:uncharacterized protein LOC131037573 [Cryptomeria japonica]